MASPHTSPDGSPPPGGVVPPDWPSQAADKIVDTIDQVRIKTTRPALVATRGVVFGLAAGVIGVVALVLLIIMLVRMWANWVPGDVWILYAVLGVVFTLGGLVFLKKAVAQPATSTS